MLVNRKLLLLEQYTAASKSSHGKCTFSFSSISFFCVCTYINQNSCMIRWEVEVNYDINTIQIKGSYWKMGNFLFLWMLVVFMQMEIKLLYLSHSFLFLINNVLCSNGVLLAEVFVVLVTWIPCMEGENSAFLFVSLARFTCLDVLHIHPFFCKWKYFIMLLLLNSIPLCVNILHFFSCEKTLVALHVFCIVNGAVINTTQAGILFLIHCFSYLYRSFSHWL